MQIDSTDSTSFPNWTAPRVQFESQDLRKLGSHLNFDPKKEVIVGDDAANAMLNRPMRKGYEVS